LPYNSTPTSAGGRRTVLTEPAGSGIGDAFGRRHDQSGRLSRQRQPNGSVVLQGGHPEWVEGR